MLAHAADLYIEGFIESEDGIILCPERFSRHVRNAISSSIRYKSVITLSSKHDYVAFTHAHATDTLFEARNTQTDRVEKGEINEKQKRSTKNVVSHISSPEAYPSSSSTCSKSWSKLTSSRYPSGTSAWPSSPPRATIAHPTPPPRPITRTT